MLLTAVARCMLWPNSLSQRHSPVGRPYVAEGPAATAERPAAAVEMTEAAQTTANSKMGITKVTAKDVKDPLMMRREKSDFYNSLVFGVKVCFIYTESNRPGWRARARLLVKP